MAPAAATPWPDDIVVIGVLGGAIAVGNCIRHCDEAADAIGKLFGNLFSDGGEGQQELPRPEDLKDIPKNWENEHGDLIHELKKGYPKGAELKYYPATNEIYVVPRPKGPVRGLEPTGVKVD